jgi:hypothetical protein
MLFGNDTKVMNVTRGAAAGALFVLVTSANPTQATPGSIVVAAAYSRNAMLRTYTFQVDVAMVMRHFPWLHFHLRGDGRYSRPGKQYVVHFTEMPFFAKNFHDIDLSVIDPTLWPKRYRYRVTNLKGNDTIFDVEGAGLRGATVALNPHSGVDWADVTYSDGTHVHVIVSSSQVDGFLLPSALNASVDYAKMPLAAKAAFMDYELHD